jgi:hypothetical protein
MVEGIPRDKAFHPWQQGLQSINYFDPFYFTQDPRWHTMLSTIDTSIIDSSQGNANTIKF